MDIRRLLDYTDNCRRLLRTTLEDQTDAFEQPIPTTGQYRTVRELVAHCVGAEQRWTEQRLLGLLGTARYEDHAAQTLPALFADWELVRAKTRGFLDDCLDAGHASRLHQEIAFSLPQWGHTDVLTVEEMLFHVFNHQTYHLGQISMALQQMGVDPPNFDYVLLHRAADEE